MKTATFTLLVTISDDGSAAVMKPEILAAALEGALEGGISTFMLDSTRAAAAGVPPGEYWTSPVASATVTALPGSLLRLQKLDSPEMKATRMHASLAD